MYIMDSTLYEETPQYDHWFIAAHLLFPLLVAAIAVTALIISPENTQVTAGIFLVIALFMGIFLWARVPHKYLIFADRLKIVCGGPLSTTIPFDSIEEASEATSEDLRAPSKQLRTCFSSKNAVLIIRILEDAVTLTPGDREEFLKHLNKALSEWRNTTKVDDETQSQRNT
jgi:hypothetical protein